MIEEQESSLQGYEDDICHQRTAGQWIAYRFFTGQSSVLSILGSSLIIFMVFRHRGQNGIGKFQNRLLLPMSVFDIIGSIGWAFSTTPIPQGSICTYGAIGNKATCATQGFMVTVGTIVPMYNAMLCIYYLLVVKYNFSDEHIAKYEPLMHFICICPPLTVSIVAVANDLFGNYVLLCWIKERDFFVPDSTRDDESSNFILIGIYMTGAICAGLVLLSIGYCMISIYRFAKAQELKMSTYQFQRPDCNDAPGNPIRRSQPSRLSNAVIDTKKQAFLYVGSFILTCSFTGLCIAFEIIKAEVPFVIMLLQGITTPLQGFWNFLAYIRPRFNIISGQHNGKSIFSRLYITVFHKPESSRQPRAGRRSRRSRRNRQPAQSSMSYSSRRSNDAAATRISKNTSAARISTNNAPPSNDSDNWRVSSFNPKTINHQPKSPPSGLTIQPQASSIEMQQLHVLHDESPLHDSHDVHDDEELI